MSTERVIQRVLLIGVIVFGSANAYATPLTQGQRDIIVPSAKDQCVKEFKETSLLKNIPAATVNEYCTCAALKVSTMATQEDLRYLQDNNGKQPVDYHVRVIQPVANYCMKMLGN
jgi:hypothetical protein